MSFKSLEQVLSLLQEQSKWQEQPFQRILKCWSDVVGVAVAAHTRPVSIGRQVLWVATSSAVWAQELSFGKQRILAKLNTHLPNPLLDIRFSTVGWQRSHSNSATRTLADLGRNHPSRVVNFSLPTIKDRSISSNPNDAFNHWANVTQARSRNLPLCPQCHCPTPEGELGRWRMCSICAAKRW